MVSMRRAILLGAVAVAAGLGCRASEPAADPRLVTGWARALYALVRAERLSPPVASRVFAYSAVALYEGLAPGSPELRSLAGQLNGLQRLPRPERDQRYDWAVVAVSAETTVVGSLFREGLPATQVAIAQLGDSQIAARAATGDRESGVEGKRVDLGGRRIIKKKKKKFQRAWAYWNIQNKERHEAARMSDSRYAALR